MKLQYQNFIGDKYKALQEEEQLFFQAAPSARLAKKAIQVTAIAPAAAVAATHLPIAGPVVAGAISQATHLMHSGIHGIRAGQIAKNFADLASQVPQGWGRQSAFDAWAKVRTADMLAKTDVWARPLSGFASPALIGKGILDTGKLAISYASQGVPTAVARPVVHAWKMTNHYINRAKDWFKETLGKLPEQLQQNIRSAIDKVQQQDIRNAIDNVQRRTTAMAENLNKAPVPNGLDNGRRADYVRLLSDSQNDPSLTYESIQQNTQSSSDLGTDYDKQVTYQALREGKSLDEATAIVAQGPKVTEMSQTKLQDVAAYLGKTTNAVWRQYNIENPSPEVSQDQALEPEAPTVAEANGAAPPPPPEEDENQSVTENPEAQAVADANGSMPPPPPEDKDPEQSSTLDPDAQSVAESNGVVGDPPDPKLKEQYVQLLSENLGEPDLTWEDIQERVNQDPDLSFDYDQRVGFQAQENGIKDPEKLSDLIADSPEWDGVERPKPAAVEEAKPGLQEDSLEAYSMIKEDILDNMVRFNNDLGNLSLRLNGERLMGLGREGSIMENKTSLTTEQAQLIRDALQNPKDHKDVEITIKIGTRVAFRLKNGVAQPDKFGIIKAAEEMAVKIPKATPEQINNLTEEQKELIKSVKKQGYPTEDMINKMVYKTQTNRPTIPKTEEREPALSR